MLNTDSEMTIDFTSAGAGTRRARTPTAVLRGPFDQWLAEKAEGCRRRVHLRHRRGGAAQGRLRRGIAACAPARTRSPPTWSFWPRACNPHPVREVAWATPVRRRRRWPWASSRCSSCPPQTIEDRFLCPKGEGAAMLFVGDCTTRLGGRRLPVHEQGVDQPGARGHHLHRGRRLAQRGAGLPDAGGLQEPPGRGPHHPRRASSWSIRATWCPRAATTWCPQYVFDGCARGRRGGGTRA